MSVKAKKVVDSKSDDDTPKRVSILSSTASDPRRLEQNIVTTQRLWKTRTADAVLAAGGAAGSLALLQWIQDYLVANNINNNNAVAAAPIIGGFLGGSAIKFFLNQSPPTLEAFWKSTVASVITVPLDERRR